MPLASFVGARALRGRAARRSRPRAHAAQGEARAPRHAVTAPSERWDVARALGHAARDGRPSAARSRCSARSRSTGWVGADDRLARSGRRARRRGSGGPGRRRWSRRRCACRAARSCSACTASAADGRCVGRRGRERVAGAASLVVVAAHRPARGVVTLDGAIVARRRRAACSSLARPGAVGRRRVGRARSSCPASAARRPGRAATRRSRSRCSFPVPHRTRVRVALGRRAARSVPRLRAMPTRSRAGWERQLDRGLQAELPAADRQSAVDAARADLLLAPRRCRRRSPRSRTGASTPKRPTRGCTARRARARRARAAGAATGSRGRRCARSTPARDPAAVPRRDARRCSCGSTIGRVDLLPGFPPEWLGQSLAVRRRCPLRAGSLSFALRWHGARPALLVGRARRASRCAAPRSTRRGRRRRRRARRLLAEPPAPLLADGDRATDRRVTPVDAPGSVLVSDDDAIERRTTTSSRPGSTTRTRPDAAVAARAARVPHRRDRRVDPRARAGARGGRAAELRRVPHASPGRRAADARARSRERGRDRCRRSRPQVWRAAGLRRSAAVRAPLRRRRRRRCSSWSAIARDARRSRTRRLQLVRTTGEAIGRRSPRPRSRCCGRTSRRRSSARRPVRRRRARRTATSRTAAAPARRRRDRHAPPPSARSRSAGATATSSAPTSSANVVRARGRVRRPRAATPACRTELDPTELAAMLDRFEATTGDVIAAAGANVVKRIGDAVMFVTNAPGVACALALELIEACAARAAAEAARRPRVRRRDRAPGRLLRPDRQPRGAPRRRGRARHRARRRRAARPPRRASAAGYALRPRRPLHSSPASTTPVEVFQLLR